MGAPYCASPLLHEQYGLPICFLAHFKVLILTYIKLFMAKKPCICWDCLSPIISAHLIRSDRVSMCWGLSMKQCHLVGPSRCPFFVTVPALWDSLRWTLTQQPFGRLKIWFPSPTRLQVRRF